jgi:hypothetical protein
MPRGTRRTSYVRDNRGRFASTPGGGAPKRPPAKRASRGTNRLTRDNSGRITSVGGNGATARGGRLRTGAGNLRARQTDRLKGAPQGVLSRGGKARGKVAMKPVGWMQSPEARKDRADPMVAGHRKDQAKRLRALPKAAQRAIRLERMNYGGTGVNRMSAMRDIAEGRVILMGNVGKRKNKRSAGEVQAIAQQMNRSATRLKAGMATGSRGRMKYNPRAVEASGKGTAARKIRGARVGGVARKGKAAPAKPAGKQRKPLTKERISAAKGKITAKLTAVLDEIRKVENAKNRDNTPASGGFSPRYLKLIARGQKADKQLESLKRASKRLKQIELSYDPAKYGYGRGTDQRKSLATEIRNARKQLTTLQREEATAKKVYEADPVVRFGLWGEIGQNRRQSRKAKERNSNAAMNRVDRYIGAGIAVRQQQNAIKQLRDKAKRQTQETNKRQKPRKP